MANSLEVRVPLLDHEFMELAAQIPSSLKLKGREGKYILKKSMEPYLSSKILYRKKMGFSIPLAQWLRGDLQELFADKIFSSNTVLQDYLNIKTVREMWQKHQAKTSDFTSEMWAVLFFSMWAERFLEGEKP
jgi:asparagine synthase (glutamine-hydrolysing)